MKRTKLFFDTEFTGLHQNTTLISIGIVSECGKTFYAECTDFDLTQCDNWIRDNVLDNCEFYGKQAIEFFNPDGDNWKVFEKTAMVAELLKKWLDKFEAVEMWSDCLAYDWVLFCQLFGHAFKVPNNVYYIPFDICTLFVAKGLDADLNREGFTFFTEAGAKHNALHDALVIKECHDRLINWDIRDKAKNLLDSKSETV